MATKHPENKFVVNPLYFTIIKDKIFQKNFFSVKKATDGPKLGLKQAKLLKIWASMCRLTDKTDYKGLKSGSKVAILAPYLLPIYCFVFRVWIPI